MKKLLASLLVLSLILVGCQKDDDNVQTIDEDTIYFEETMSETTDETMVESMTETMTESRDEESTTVTISSYDANGEKINVEVPKNPTNVAVLDLATLDTIDALGKGDSIKGFSKGSNLPGKETYYENDEIKNLGTVKEVDLEELVALKPEIIFIGGRLSAQYEDLSKIAPVVYMSVNSDDDPFNSAKENILEIAKIYDALDIANEKLTAYEERLNEVKTKSNGANALVALVTKGDISLLGDNGRGSMITLDGGFTNLTTEDSSTHGNSVSFESILDLNPDYIFVLDRDSAINAEGAMLAKDILDNEIIHKTNAYMNDRIIYLNPSIWYLAEGGLGALDTMISDIESAVK